MRQADPRLLRLNPFLEEAEKKIRDAAEHGKNNAGWTVGTEEFVEDILRILRAQGFTVSCDKFHITVKW